MKFLYLFALSSVGTTAIAFSAPDPPEVPPADAAEVRVPEGYEVHVVVRDLTYPSSIEFDDKGNFYIAEAGYSYGDSDAKPRILKVSPSGDISVWVDQGLVGPINDLLWHNGELLISHRGKISVIADGALRDLVTDLPSDGDHQNNQMTVGPEGKIYFGQGTVSNSGVVGPDNAEMGWLKKHPELHDVPPKQIKIKEKTFESKNPLDPSSQTTTTMAYHAFGSRDESATVPGAIKANGTILRMDPTGQNLEVYAWGLRNPFGLQWTANGILYATENGMDVRGSRPIANDREDLYEIKQGAWYGWPDFASGLPVTDAQFAPPGGPRPDFLLVDHPNVEKPLVEFPQHSAAAKIAVSPGGSFGREGHLFIAFFGHMSPMTGATSEHGGHRIVEFDPLTESIETFFTNADHGGSGHSHSGETNSEKSSSSPAEGESKSANHGSKDESVTSGPRRPLDVCFAPDGGAMYIADFGTLVVKDNKPLPIPQTGVIWRVVPKDADAADLPANITLDNLSPQVE